MTLSELLQCIARTAPVGAISSAYLLPNQSRHDYFPNPDAHWPPASGDMLAAGAKVCFNQRGAALELVRLSMEKVFKVRRRTPYVTEDRKYQLHYSDAPPPPPLNQYIQTRVLVLQGSPRVEGFDEEFIRGLLRSDRAAMLNAGPFGDLSEPVKPKILGNGLRRMEWRFFSYASQALPFKKVIKKHFGNRLDVKHGRDPCCPVEIWEKERTKNLEHGKAIVDARIARKEERAREAREKDGGRKSPTEALRLASEDIREGDRAWDQRIPVRAWQSITEHTPRERHPDDAMLASQKGSELNSQPSVDLGRTRVWSERVTDRLVTRSTAAEQTHRNVDYQTREPIPKDEPVAADRSVAPDNTVEKATETASTRPTEPFGAITKRGIASGWEEEQVADGLSPPEQVIEEATETSTGKGMDLSWKEKHVTVGPGTEDAIVEVVTETAPAQPIETTNEQGIGSGWRDEHLANGAITPEPIVEEVTETSTGQPTEATAEQGRVLMADGLVTEEAIVQEATETNAGKGIEPSSKEEHVADESVTGEAEAMAQEAIEISIGQPTETTAEQEPELITKEEHMTEGSVTRESIVEQTIEIPTPAESSREHVWRKGHLETSTIAPEMAAEQRIEPHAEHDTEHTWKEGHLKAAVLALDTTTERSTGSETHAGPGRKYTVTLAGLEDQHLEVGPVSREMTAQQVTEATADQDREHPAGGRPIMAKQSSLALVAVAAR